MAHTGGSSSFEVWHMGQAGARALKHGIVRKAKSFTVATAKDVNPPSPN